MNKMPVFLLLTALILSACTHNAITGRKQLGLIPEKQLQQLALTEYRTFLSRNRVISASSSRDADMIRRVGSRIANAITQYYTEKGQGNILNGYAWEFNLIDSREVNAWCMPGGKVVFYTGLLPVAQNEAAVAVVMGHEIAHAVAHHGNERMSKAMIAQGIGMVGDILTQRDPKVNNLFNNIFAPAAQVGVLLPNSRSHEYEADKYGLFFAAMAGYNPQEAVPFWQRMSMATGQKPPEFLATHPSDANRIAKLQDLMPEALRFYRPIGQ